MTEFKDVATDTLSVERHTDATFTLRAIEHGRRAVLDFLNSDAGKVAAAVLEAGGVEPLDEDFGARVDSSRPDGVGVVDEGTGNFYTPKYIRRKALAFLRAADEADAQNAKQETADPSTYDGLVERVARRMYEQTNLSGRGEWANASETTRRIFRDRARELVKED